MKRQYSKPTSKYILLHIEECVMLQGSNLKEEGDTDAGTAMTHKQEPVIEETNSPW